VLCDWLRPHPQTSAGAITAWNGLALAQHATSRNYGAVREVPADGQAISTDEWPHCIQQRQVHHVAQATVMTTAIGEASCCSSSFI